VFCVAFTAPAADVTLPAKPVRVGSAEELEKLVPNEAERTKFAEGVDFKTHEIAFFRWKGSGQDKLTMKLEKGKDGKEVVAFFYQRGFSKDLRTHDQHFVVPKKAEWVARAGVAACGEEPGPGCADEPNLPGKVDKFRSVDELEKAVPDAKEREKLAAGVDFKTHDLVLVSWQGSGGDRITLTVEKGEKGPVAVFTYTRGLTDDLRSHRVHFAVPKKATWVVKVAG
jgi:hypothetical protein